VVDAVDVALAEDLADGLIERAGGREVAPERLFDDEARPCAGLRRGEPGFAEALGDGRVGVGRRREVEETVAAGAVGVILLSEAFAEARVRREVVELAGNVVQVAGKAVPELVLERLTRELRDGLLHLGAELLIGLLAAGEANDGEAAGQKAPAGEVVERWHELARRQVARGAEDHDGACVRSAVEAHACSERVGGNVCRHDVGGSTDFTAWPPNSFRSAACTFALKDDCWRDEKRRMRESVMIGRGTSWSSASCTVQRPSPESCT
jgi:hypothetical protein